MPPRRSHKKSRAGCRRCKSRKIKCDEIRPRCYNCEKHGVQCDFEFPNAASDIAHTPRTSYASTPGATPAAATPAGSFAVPATPSIPSIKANAAAIARLGPPPSVSPTIASPTSLALAPPASASAAARLLEMRLLHHYTTETSKTLSCQNPSAEQIWRDNVPRVAFAAASGSVNAASNHLTDAVLAVAALHLRSEFPQDRELIRASHAYMGSSLSEYNRLLQQGITASNAEALFLNSTLIAFQSTATRIFSKDEQPSASAHHANGQPPARDPYSLSHMSIGVSSGNYGLPMSWFHAFQGVKAITAASWPWLRRSNVVLPIINAQPALHLDIASAKDGFFGHLLDGVDEELAAVASASGANKSNSSAAANECHVASSAANDPSSSRSDQGAHRHHSPSCVCTSNSERDAELEHQHPHPAGSPTTNSHQIANILRDSVHVADDPDESARTRHAYQHAVAVLNWAHGMRNNGACLAFPATVSRRFVELLSSRTPRALTILACFFAMLKTLDSVWWLHGMARREVLGVVSMFNSDAVPVDVERRWWPHMQWAVRVALYHDDNHPSDYVPTEVWGASWHDTEDGTNGGGADTDDAAGLVSSGAGAGAGAGAAAGPESYVHHIDMITETINNGGVPSELNEFNFASL
ncbi:hypothetical protein HMPREF1624_07538 [Sporothrix schenckii ATCC 58251]|uniref:Zn(2)-C6 fungal-type domain-containing protein n=1 Tax=Sporothrix schenckii (strain ATCC 58251 / de Perez 2211183) TaxID=1391915 RepID=U7PK35_SPOS1|nr:hypothetical protein HMPREF1624_07538 [Sporothrix schenckii ATCC 58251]